MTETLNVLINDGSSIGSHMLDLIAPPKLTLGITQLPPLNQKRFLRDLRSGKAKLICVLVTEDEYVRNIRSAVVFSENARVLSSSSMDESVLVRRLRSSDIHTNRGNRSRLILSTMISWNSVLIPEAVPVT